MFQYGTRGFKIDQVTASHDGQGALFCAYRAARNGGVKIADVQSLQSFGMVFGLGRLDRRHVNKQAVFAHSLRNAMIENNRLHNAAVFEHGDGQVRLCNRQRRVEVNRRTQR